MNVSCPQCKKQLKLGEKFIESLKSLGSGQKPRVKCSQCATIIVLDPAALQPSLTASAATVGHSRVKPPLPPDVSWLKDGAFADKEVVEEIPQALVLIPEQSGRAAVAKAVETLGYRAEISESAEEAIDKMEFVNYASVFLHAEFEPGQLQSGSFYRHMCAMNMAKRRYIFYVLIGKEFHTLYDLQALACSANITVNDGDIPHFATILRKAIPDYEMLFGPLMEELRVRGK